MVRRLKKYYLSEEEIPFMFTTGVTHEMIKGLPAGATLVVAHHDFENKRVAFVFEHESFPDVGEGVPGMLETEVALRQA